MHTETRSPDRLTLHAHGIAHRATLVEKRLHEARVRPLRCVIHRRHDPVHAIGKRRDHRHAPRREVEDHLIRGHTAGETHIGKQERFAIAATSEGDAAHLPNGAVHAVAADDEARSHRSAIVKLRIDAVPVLPKPSQLARAQHLATQHHQALEQHTFRDGLRDHQGVWVASRQVGEPDRHEHPVAVADGEARGLDAQGNQRVGNAQRLQDLERASMDHRGPRGVGPGRLAIDDGACDPACGQRRRKREAGGAGTDDQYIGVVA